MPSPPHCLSHALCRPASIGIEVKISFEEEAMKLKFLLNRKVMCGYNHHLFPEKLFHSLIHSFRDFLKNTYSRNSFCQTLGIHQ